MIQTMEPFNDELRSSGSWVSGEGLDYSANAKTVRVSDGQRTVTDGPYWSGKEQFAGLWIIEADTIEDAVDRAKRVPLSGGAVEVRPLVPADAGVGAADVALAARATEPVGHDAR